MSRRAVIGRVSAIIVVLCTFPSLVAARLLPAAPRRVVVTGGARLLLRAIGIGLEVDRAGAPPGRVPADSADARPRGTLVVANHVSWTDIVVLSALYPARFVARADLVTWPLLGTVSRLVRVIPIDRASLRSLPGTVEEVTQVLRGGGTVVVFPEGTTWCGRAHGTFRPALFQSAIDAGASIHPISISYRDAAGALTTAPAFVGDEGIGACVARIVRMSAVRATVRIGPPVQCAPDHHVPGPRSRGRRDLAARCNVAVHGAIEPPLTVGQGYLPAAQAA